MKKYFATFGVGHVNSNKVQPIIADSVLDAERKMFEVYGKEWAFVYEENQLHTGKEHLPDIKV